MARLQCAVSGLFCFLLVSGCGAADPAAAPSEPSTTLVPAPVEQAGQAPAPDAPANPTTSTGPADLQRPAVPAVSEGPPSNSGVRRDALQPKDFVYLGAFRLPAGTGGSNWEYSMAAMTYCPSGDPQGADDGFPGSIFAIGHDHQQMISEISIPAPVLSASKQVQDLPVAATLQPFADVRGGLVGELEIPRAGIEYLPSQIAGERGKLHFCWGQHFQFERAASHGWCALSLDRPNPQGLWRLADYSNYVVNDYLFEIPPSWADEHLPGYRLATGRFRDGQWGGLGPALLAYAPPSEESPPPNGAVISNVRPLLMYGKPQAGAAELEVNDAWRMKDFSEADEWSGGAWLTRGERHAVALVGTKAVGNTWYGFANGVVYPISGDPNDPIPEVPPFPFDARGWWSRDVSARIILFDPNELAAVAKGERESWTPQPYAVLPIDEHLFDAGYDHPRYKRYLLGACCFDREHGVLYVAERQVEQDEERSLVHAFRLSD